VENIENDEGIGSRDQQVIESIQGDVIPMAEADERKRSKGAGGKKVADRIGYAAQYGGEQTCPKP